MPSPHSTGSTALINLMDNGCKYSDPHEVKVIVLPENHSLKVTFIDQGIGIEKDDMPYMAQVSTCASLKRKCDGIWSTSGLGRIDWVAQTLALKGVGVPFTYSSRFSCFLVRGSSFRVTTVRIGNVYGFGLTFCSFLRFK
jgi:hypothetical protein